MRDIPAEERQDLKEKEREETLSRQERHRGFMAYLHRLHNERSHEKKALRKRRAKSKVAKQARKRNRK